MLARADGRQRELAVRAALGASRWRLVHHLLAEAAVLALAGGGAGVLIAYWSVRAFVASHPTTIPRIDLIGVDWRVLIFALGGLNVRRRPVRQRPRAARIRRGSARRSPERT